MRPYCCRLKASNLARVLLTFDIFRAMLVSPVLIGVFFGMACVQIHKFKETIIPDDMFNVGRVDYYKNRKMLVYSIVSGITICGIDILMALALDKILLKGLRNAYIVWLTLATMTLLVRNAFYAFIWKNRVQLGLHRLDDLTPTVKLLMEIMFLVAVAYEIVKTTELFIGFIVPWEFDEKRIVPESCQSRNRRAPTTMLRLF